MKWVYQVLPSQLCQLYWLDKSLLNYLHASEREGFFTVCFLHRDIMLILGYASYSCCILHTARCAVLSLSHPHRTWCGFYYLFGLHRQMWRISTLFKGEKCVMWQPHRLTLPVLSVFVTFLVLCNLGANIISYLLIWIIFAWLFCFTIPWMWSCQLVLRLRYVGGLF